MRPTTFFLLLSLGASGCDYADGSQQIGQPLGGEAFGMGGRIWMLSPGADAVVTVDAATFDSEAIPVGRGPSLLTRAPGADRLYTLDLDDRTMTRLLPDGSTTQQSIRAPFNRVDWSPDGARAILWLDPNAGIDVTLEGSVNRNAFALLRDDGAEWSLEAGTFDYAPQGIHWDDQGRRALVRTAGRLSVFDFGTEPTTHVSVPFSADESALRAPQLVAIAPDGGRALISVASSTDLFVLDLEPVLIENVVGLPRSPDALAFSADGTRAVVGDGSVTVQFIDLESFQTEGLTLDHQVRAFLPSRTSAEPFVLAYAPMSQGRFTRLPLGGESLAPDDYDTYAVEALISELAMSPGEEAAVAIHGWADDGMGISELSLLHFERRAPSRILLDTPASDLLFLDGALLGENAGPAAVITLKDSGRIVRYDLATYEQVVLDTYALPTQVGLLPASGELGSQLFVMHEQEGGLVSFVEPAANQVPPGGFPGAFGFAFGGVLDWRAQ